MTSGMDEVKEKVSEIEGLAQNVAAERRLAAQRLAEEAGKVLRLRAELEDVSLALYAGQGDLTHTATTGLGRQVEEILAGRDFRDVAQRSAALRAFLTAYDAADQGDGLDKRTWIASMEKLAAAAARARVALGLCPCGEPLKEIEGRIFLCRACHVGYRQDGVRVQ